MASDSSSCSNLWPGIKGEERVRGTEESKRTKEYLQVQGQYEVWGAVVGDEDLENRRRDPL